jgi:hypothetical protein
MAGIRKQPPAKQIVAKTARKKRIRPGPPTVDIDFHIRSWSFDYRFDRTEADEKIPQPRTDTLMLFGATDPGAKEAV